MLTDFEMIVDGEINSMFLDLIVANLRNLRE